METDLPHYSCSRFHDNKNQAFQYVLDEILQQCTPKHLLKSTQIISNSISEHPLFNQNDQLTGIKSLTVNAQMKLNRISQSSTTTTTMETSADPIFF
ncbi:unnamed protein product [Rotaria sordida]|uniref:Uncharacterized protein n=1 Tax=Rotaria sordida TaxID=392033 RepID=A0A818W250_9BILA|nr:unnamed protein product [Rotaria sordida]